MVCVVNNYKLRKTKNFGSLSKSWSEIITGITGFSDFILVFDINWDLRTKPRALARLDINYSIYSIELN